MTDVVIEAVTAKAVAGKGPERPPRSRADLIDSIVRHLKGIIGSLEELQKLEQTNK